MPTLNMPKSDMPKSGMPSGALAMLILRVLHSGPLHGYAIAQRIYLLSSEVLEVEEGSLYPALQKLLLKGWASAASLKPTARSGFTGSRLRDNGNWKPSLRITPGSRKRFNRYCARPDCERAIHGNDPGIAAAAELPASSRPPPRRAGGGDGFPSRDHGPRRPSRGAAAFRQSGAVPGAGARGLGLAAARVLRRGLYGISALDPISCAAPILVVLSVFVVAAILPSRRALRLDIARALHEE
jgi:hypothetical protein